MPQGLDDIEHHHHPALHVDNARTVGYAVSNIKGVIWEGAAGKYGIQVSAEQDRFSRSFRPIYRYQHRNLTRGNQPTV